MHKLPKAVSMAPYDSGRHPAPGLVSTLYPMVHIIEMRLKGQTWIKHRVLMAKDRAERLGFQASLASRKSVWFCKDVVQPIQQVWCLEQPSSQEDLLYCLKILVVGQL